MGAGRGHKKERKEPANSCSVKRVTVVKKMVKIVINFKRMLLQFYHLYFLC